MIKTLPKQGFTAKRCSYVKKGVVKWTRPLKSFKLNTNGVKLSLRTDLENTKKF